MRKVMKGLRGKEHSDGSLVGHRKFGIFISVFSLMRFLSAKQIFALVDMFKLFKERIVFSTRCKCLSIFCMHLGVLLQNYGW